MTALRRFALAVFALMIVAAWAFPSSRAGAAESPAAHSSPTGDPAASPESFATPDRVPTVLEAIDIALGNGRDVASAVEGIREAQVGAFAARSALSWRIDLTGARDVGEGPNPVNGQIVDQSATAASLSIRRTFAFDPAVRRQLEQADLGAERARIALEQTASETVLAVFEAYRGLELALVRRQLLAESVRTAGMAWEVAQDRARVETLAREDAEAARLDYREAELDYEASERMLEIARTALADRLGVDDLPEVDELPVPSLAELLDEIRDKGSRFWPVEPIPQDKGVEADLESLRLRAEANRPEVRLAELGVRQAEIALDLARLSRRPVLFAEGNYERLPEARASVSFNSRGGLEATLVYTQAEPEMELPESWSVRVGVNVNLWDSAAAALEIEKASSALRQAAARREQAKAAVGLDVSSRHADVIAAHGRLLLKSERALLAADRLAAEQRRLELGLATRLSIAARQMELHAAVLEALAARFEYEQAVLSLAAGAGAGPEELRTVVGRL